MDKNLLLKLETIVFLFFNYKYTDYCKELIFCKLRDSFLDEIKKDNFAKSENKLLVKKVESINEDLSYFMAIFNFYNRIYPETLKTNYYEIFEQTETSVKLYCISKILDEIEQSLSNRFHNLRMEKDSFASVNDCDINNKIELVRKEALINAKSFFQSEQKALSIEYQLIEIKKNTNNNLNSSIYPLNTNLDYPTRKLLYTLLISGKFIDDITDKENFIWSFGKSDLEIPVKWKQIQWQESKLAFVELMRPILRTITNKHKRNIENLFLDEYGNPMKNIKTPKKDEVSARYGNICDILNQLKQ